MTLKTVKCWRKKNSPSAALCIINSIWTNLNANSGLRGEIPATNSLFKCVHYFFLSLYSFITVSVFYVLLFSAFLVLRTYTARSF
jgi:hypothetical protein